MISALILFRVTSLTQTTLLIAVIFANSGHALDGPLSDQIKSMRAITTLQAEMSRKHEGETGPFLQSMISKGQYSRFFERPGNGWQKPEGNRMVGSLWSETKGGLSELDLFTGQMDIFRRDPVDGKLKGPDHIKNRASPVLLDPFSFLDIDDDGIPGEGFIPWSELWDDVAISARIRHLIKSVRDDRAGGIWLIEPVRNPELKEDGTIASKDQGGTYQIHVNKPTGTDEMRLITEIRFFKTASDTEPNAVTMYSYQYVKIGLSKVPILLHSEGKARGQSQPFTSSDVISVICGSPIDDSKLEIDPALASSIHDGSTGVSIEPER